MRLNKKVSCMVVFCAVIVPLYANALNTLPINEIALRLHAEQWVNTSTALVSVSINAAVTDQGLEKVRAQVMAKLNSLGAGDWHLTDFNRQQDKSGLETVQITAEARLLQAALNNLRTQAKNISKPGETYTIDNIEFTPSQDEINQANVALRANIYQQAKAELDQINKFYPDQKYYVHNINFNFPPLIAPMPMMAMARSATPAQNTSVNTSSKITLDASVDLASTIPMPNDVNANK